MLSRRDFLGATAAALVGLTRKGGRPLAGGFADDGMSVGHRLRDRAAFGRPARRERVRVVVVGGGIAGLSAAWRMAKRGMRDFVVLELEGQAGGNARWGENAVSRFPWGAHYVPVPGPSSAPLVRELFADLGVLTAGPGGEAWEERHLCFAPKERLFIHGRWEEGLEAAALARPYASARRERDDWRRFQERVAELRATGAFTIPSAAGLARRDGPAAARVRALDALSATDWLRQEGFTAPSLHWMVDYACRDDYGARAAQTSAWAAAHYFAARPEEDPGPLTWPEGNGWIVRRLLETLAPHVRTGAPAYRVEPLPRASAGGARVRVLTEQVEYLADAVVFATPTFLAPYVVEGMGGGVDFQYSPWLTANLTLDRWPAERGAPPAWDNVLHDSPALGYVVATHQSLRSTPERDAPTVWTYYWALADGTPAAARAWLLRQSWRALAESILADLERAHPDLRACVSRIDVMRMGHAMVRPAPGFLASPARARLAAPAGDGRVLFAHSDLGGLSLFEEAQARGVTAAERVLARI